MDIVEHVRGLMREIGPLAKLGSVVEMNDAPIWQIEFDETYGLEAVLDPEDGRLSLIAVMEAPQHIELESLVRQVLTHNAGWPHETRACAGLRGTFLSMAGNCSAKGLQVSDLAARAFELRDTLHAFHSALLTRPDDGETTEHMMRV